jgi:hypothetical protein
MSESNGATLYTEATSTNSAEFKTLAKEAAELLNTIALLKADYEEKRKALEPFIAAAGVASVIVPEDEAEYALNPHTAPAIRLTLVAGRKSRTLSTEKLIKLGVREALILAATVEKQGEPYLKLTTRASAEVGE